MKFDPTISLGTILHLVALLVTLVAVYWKMRELVFRLHNEALAKMNELHAVTNDRLTTLETKMDTIWGRFKSYLGGT